MPNKQRQARMRREAPRPAKPQMTPDQFEQLRRILERAAERLGKKDEFKQDPNKTVEATRFVRQEVEKNPGMTALQIAQTALLGVANAMIAGGERVLVPTNWGNQMNIPDQNPYHGGSTGGAVVDQVNRVDFSWQDYRGFEGKTIDDQLENMRFGPDFVKYLERLGFDEVQAPANSASDDITSFNPQPRPPVPPIGE